MSSQRKLIDGVHSFSPVRESWVKKPAEALPDRLSVHFASGRIGRLDLKDPLSAHWANMIDRQSLATRIMNVSDWPTAVSRVI